MQVTVNAETRDIPEGATVESLIEHLGLATAICAAEVNDHLIPRDQRDAHRLQDGDKVEIVTLVGGG